MKNLIRLSLVAVLSIAASGAAMAQRHGGGFHGGGPGWHGHNGWHPGGWHGGGWRGGYRGYYGPRFGFYGGWPLGFFAATLPLGYSSVWVGGSPYYYANGAYWAPSSGGYTVVQPPQQVVVQQAAPAAPVVAAAPAPIYYPRTGQSGTQTESDRRACNTWATTQPSAMADASVFQRATMACMEGRGYTVK